MSFWGPDQYEDWVINFLTPGKSGNILKLAIFKHIPRIVILSISVKLSSDHTDD